jgi:hypothetical protein
MSDRETGAEGDLLTRIHDTLAEAGLHVAGEVDDGTLYLSGEVDSEANRQAALDVAHAVADPHGLRVDDAIDVLPRAPEAVSADAEPGDRGRFGYLDPDRDDDLVLDPGFEGEPDFTDEIGTTDPMEAAEEAIPYFPPTDPVVRPSDDEEELAVVGGFQATAMDGEQQKTGFDYRPDDDISRDVLRELREDALTTDLVVEVATRQGVVHLRGKVPTLEDAENAEAVASRVGGVKEVREELVIASLRHARRR